MRHSLRRLGRAGLATLALGLILTSCGETPSGGVSAPIGPDVAERLCAQLGFGPGSAGLGACITRLDGLTRQQAANQRQCEGIRQRAINTPFPSGGTGNTIATADADYQSCMSGQLIPPAQLQLPSGRTATCRVIRQDIACN